MSTTNDLADLSGDDLARLRDEGRLKLEPAQLDKAALSTMTPAQIVEARRAGQLDELMGRKVATA